MKTKIQPLTDCERDSLYESSRNMYKGWTLTELDRWIRVTLRLKSTLEIKLQAAQEVMNGKSRINGDN